MHSVMYVDPDRRAVCMDPTDWIELANRPTLWRLLWRLVEAHQEEPGHGVPLDDLVRATYPGEHLLPEAAANRIYYSIATLRKAGLRPVLQRREDGYLLDPSWELYEGVSGILSRRLPSNDRPTDVRTNLTPHATQFIHRRSLLERMEDHLNAGARLMVLQGPGGAGKTRLSREFGLAHQEDFEGGVWFCDLSAVQSGAALVAMVARVLSVPLSDSAGGDDGQLGTALKGRGPTLLILDNFERLTALATSILAPWLQDAPELRLLVTSRERLPLTQAQVIYVSSLTEEEALELLMDRGKAVRPGFEIADRELALKLLEGLDRLPLAVELAAARTNVLNLNQLYARLEDRFRLLRSRHTDRPPRQATMQATIDWSWNQATPIEALALAQCSTFRGSFTLEAAEAVLDLEGFPNAPWFEEVIESLVDQSLVQRQEPEPGVLRFRLLESVQDYAAARLRDPKAIVGPSHEALTGPEIAETLEGRHRAFFARYGRDAVIDALNRQGGLELRGVLSRDIENLLAAVESGLERQTPSEVSRAWNAAFWGVLCLQGPFRVTAQRARELLQALDYPPLDEARLRLTEAFAWFRVGTEAEAGTEAARKALALAQAHQATSLQADALLLLGVELLAKTQLDQADSLLRQAHTTAKALTDRQRLGRALGHLGMLASRRGHNEQAHANVQEAIGLLRAVGDLNGEAALLTQQGHMFGHQGRYTEARRCYTRALELHEQVGDQRSQAVVLANLAVLVRDMGAGDSEGYNARAMEVSLAIGDLYIEALSLLNIGFDQLEAGHHAEAREHFERALHKCDNVGYISGMARAQLAFLHATQGAFAIAGRLLDEAEQILANDLRLLGFVHCRRTDVEHLAGHPERARAALDKAQHLLQQLNLSTQAALHQDVRTRQRLLGRDG